MMMMIMNVERPILKGASAEEQEGQGASDNEEEGASDDAEAQSKRQSLRRRPVLDFRL